MGTLDLVLMHKWYDMTASGEKTEEYREDKPYWRKRLLQCFGTRAVCREERGSCALCPFIKFKAIDSVTIRRGYTPTCKTFETLDMIYGRGNPDWGAPTDKSVFIIRHGKEIH